MRHRRPQHSRRQRSAPAAFGSSTSTPQAPNPDCPRNGARPRSSSNSPSSKEPNFGVKPRSVRIEPELRGDEVNDELEPRLLRKLEAMLGFALHFDERIARREKVRVQTDRSCRRRT